MPYDPSRHHRRSIRLKGYDYAQPGAYFITLVAQDRARLFGRVVEGVMRLNTAGLIARDVWLALPRHFPALALDVWVIMPDHMHGLLVLSRGEASTAERMTSISGHAAEASSRARPNGTAPGSIGAILQNYKSISTRKINAARHTPGVRVWQRNYYEHIVRSQAALNRIRQYIRDNPARWTP